MASYRERGKLKLPVRLRSHLGSLSANCGLLDFDQVLWMISIQLTRIFGPNFAMFWVLAKRRVIFCRVGQAGVTNLESISSRVYEEAPIVNF